MSAPINDDDFVPLGEADLMLLESVAGRRISYDMAALSDDDLMVKTVLAGEEYARLMVERRRRAKETRQ